MTTITMATIAEEDSTLFRQERNHLPEKVSVQITLAAEATLPEYATEGSSGLDLKSLIDFELAPLERKLVPTGIRIALPLGYEAQIRPRSGLALKQGLTCLNSPGTIDSDYRGEIGVILVNLSHQSTSIKKGDRIAQMVIAKVEQVDFELVAELSPTIRSTGGFGSTGKS